MSLEELFPLFQELTTQPGAFLGGLCAGALRLKLTDDPVKSWLSQQAGTTLIPYSENGSQPRSISID
jgi:hypothetical protein